MFLIFIAIYLIRERPWLHRIIFAFQGLNVHSRPSAGASGEEAEVHLFALASVRFAPLAQLLVDAR
jgi:hypothetical protein